MLALKPRVTNKLLVDPSLVDMTAFERYVLDYFVDSGCYNTPTYLFDAFWCQRIHAIGAVYPAVKHATIALSGTFIQFGFVNTGSPDRGKDLEPFILRQSNKALSEILELLSKPPDASALRVRREVAMSCCTIMGTVCLFRGELDSAWTHFTYGLKAMKEWQDAGYDDSSIGPMVFQALKSLKPKLIACHDGPVSFITGNSLALAGIPELEAYDAAAEDSVNSFFVFWAWLIADLHLDGFSLGSIVDSYTPIPSRDYGIMLKVQIRNRQITNYIQRIGESSAPQMLHDVSILMQLWEQIMYIKVGTAAAVETDPGLQPFQTRYDGLWNYFQRANELGGKLLQSQIQQGFAKPSFPIESAVIVPIFFCGFYCREWTLRRQALQLLKGWEVRIKGLNLRQRAPVRSLERLIDIESEGLEPGDVPRSYSRIHYARVSMHMSKERLSYLRGGIPGIVDFY